MARIELHDITHSYLRRPKTESDYALKRIDTVWEDGGAYALLGPSGCGKTTLLNIISGLLQPTTGHVLYDGKDVSALTPEKRNIAQVFQFPVLYDTMTVFGNLAFPLQNRGFSRSKIRDRVHEVADILDLTHVINKRAAGLSADLKQKVSLGRGLVRNDVAAILFDEPLTVIDPHLKWTLRRKLKEIHERLKLTLIYVTHDQVEALTFADQVAIMLEGEIVQIGTPQDLFQNPEHTFVGFFIGSPGMNFLECTVEGNEARVDGVLIPLDEKTAAQGRTAQGKLELGIRPMYLDVRPKPDDTSVESQVTMIEDQGSHRIVTIDLAGHTLRAKVPEGNPISEGRVWVHFPKERIRLFADGQVVT